MPKTKDTPFEDWKAPWEEAGEEIDPAKVRKLIYDLRCDKDSLQDRVTATTTERDNVKTELSTLQQQVDSKAREGESEVDRLKRENEQLKSKADEAGKTSIETLRLRAALKVGLSEDHVDRLIGTTSEELEADAKKLKESFGGSGKSDDEGNNDGETPRGRPRPVRTPGDPAPGTGPELDVDKALASIPRFNSI